MEALLASAIGLLTAAGFYLILRLRTFPVIVGTSLLSYAVNLYLMSSGRLARDMPPIIDKYADGYTDPLPQALVLTAIVIGFGMTAVVVLIALGAFLESDTDHIDMSVNDPEPDSLLPGPVTANDMPETAAEDAAPAGRDPNPEGRA